MITLIATPGAANANTYATIAQASVYHAAHLNGNAWFNAPQKQAQALVMATRLLDRTVQWRGSRASTTQALAWPALNEYYAHSGEPIPSNIIPQWLVDATCELARHLIETGQGTSGQQVAGLKVLRIGPYTFEMDPQTQPMIPNIVLQMIAPYVASTSSGICRRLVRA